MILSLGLHHTGKLTTSVKLNRHRRTCMEARFHPHIQHQDERSRQKRPTDILLFSYSKNTEVVAYRKIVQLFLHLALTNSYLLYKNVAIPKVRNGLDGVTYTVI